MLGVCRESVFTIQQIGTPRQPPMADTIRERGVSKKSQWISAWPLVKLVFFLPAMCGYLYRGMAGEMSSR